VSAFEPTDLESRSRSRILRLELFVLATMFGFAYFAWISLKHEKTLEIARLSQDRSLQNLAASVASGNTKVDALTRSVEVVTANLVQSSSRIGEFSNQLGQRQNELQYLDARIRRVEFDLRKSQQSPVQAIDTLRSSALWQQLFALPPGIIIQSACAFHRFIDTDARRLGSTSQFSRRNRLLAGIAHAAFRRTYGQASALRDELFGG
jgi:septal ring factor EnvC (AmiA/AmiB activator)